MAEDSDPEAIEVKAMSDDERVQRKYVCDRCGAEMLERNCKVVCSNCGNRFDCSDLTLYFD